VKGVFTQNMLFYVAASKLGSILTVSHAVVRPGLPDGLFSNQKSQIWVNFGGPLNGKCWYIL
jgi:hypothetical protein